MLTVKLNFLKMQSSFNAAQEQFIDLKNVATYECILIYVCLFRFSNGGFVDGRGGRGRGRGRGSFNRWAGDRQMNREGMTVALDIFSFKIFLLFQKLALIFLKS